MAALIDANTGNSCFLHAHHSFGRLTYAVDTLINQPRISKHHAIIEWHNDSWHIRDLSRNGTWLNDTKLKQNNRYQLNLNDKISMGDPDNQLFLVANLNAPCDLLIPVGAKVSSEQTVALSRYHLLPNEQHPEVVVFIDPAEQQWCIEHFEQQQNPHQNQQENQDQHHNVTPLNEHDVIEFGGQKWQLKLSHLETPTEQFEPLRHQLDELNFVFDLSFDEEVTELRLITPEDTIEFYARSHHYLTLNLARYRASDAQNGIEPQKQGWVYPEQLMKDLGLDISHLNIQIHRARKQFSDVLHGLCDAQSLIVRQAGKLRFGGSLFSVYKGHKLECESKGSAGT